MKTGDTVRDPGGRTFQVGQLIGRGLWGKTYTCREEPSGAEWILKAPLGPDAFAADSEDMARICREIALEQARVLSQAAGVGLVRAEARFVTETGIPLLVMPRMATNLAARIEAGATLQDVLEAIAAVAQQLRGLTGGPRVHGNLRPTNILADGRGGWLLSDPLTDTLRRHLPALARARSVALSWLPPEARARQEQPLSDPSVDSHALAWLLLRAAMTPREGGGPPPLPDDGLDKATLVALKDAVRDRLAAEPSNPRFHARFGDRLSTLLNRALSRETSPSPPYRFPRMDEFQTRVTELAALVNPRVSHVGRVLLDRPPGSSAYNTDEEITFSCSVGCSPGVETHEDVGCGLAVFDMDGDKRLRDVPCSYTVDRHPSGRFRFGFRVNALPPGAYRVRLAFTIRDSGHEPVTAEGELQVHPAAGYVPPRTEPEPKAIRFAPREEPEVVTEVGTVPPPRPSPAAQAAARAELAAEAAQAQVAPTARIEAVPAPDEVVPQPRPLPPAQVEAGGPVVQLRPSPAVRPTVSPPPPEPEYRGAGRWTDLPLPGTGGPAPVAPDPYDQDLTEPLDPRPRTGVVDRLLELAQGDTYRLFIGAAVVVILLLIIALVALR
ncbi:hypothetical protein L6R53_25660 [Myxococcota bacterium]|nr:hypothetical protein [Myxococcota bacterium]